MEAILAIQSASPEIAQWSERDYARVARGEMAGWIAQEGESSPITGFLIARQIAGDLEILNLAVRPGAKTRDGHRTSASIFCVGPILWRGKRVA